MVQTMFEVHPGGVIGPFVSPGTAPYPDEPNQLVPTGNLPDSRQSLHAAFHPARRANFEISTR
jgi:hypothetical protein